MTFNSPSQDFGTFSRVHDHAELVQAVCDAWRYDATDAEWEAFLIALGDIPLTHCIKAAVELVRTDASDYRPNRGRWREIASALYNAELRKRESGFPRITQERTEDREAEHQAWHNSLIEKAEAGDEFFRTLVGRMAGFGNKGAIKRFQEDTFDVRLAELDRELDREQRERLEKMKPAQLEARRECIMRMARRTKGGATLSETFSFCDGCGKLLKKGAEAYVGPAPDRDGDAALCGTCQPMYSWAKE